MRTACLCSELEIVGTYTDSGGSVHVVTIQAVMDHTEHVIRDHDYVNRNWQLVEFGELEPLRKVAHHYLNKMLNRARPLAEIRGVNSE